MDSGCGPCRINMYQQDDTKGTKSVALAVSPPCAEEKKKKKRGHGINYFPYSASIFGQHVSHLFSAIMELNASTNLYHIYPDVPRSLIGSHVE